MKKKNQLLEQAKEIHKLLSHMNLTLAPLESDVNFSVAEWEKDEKSQFWRRCVIRCVFAATEAILWNMKHITPKIALVSGVILTQKDLEVANEQRVTIVNGQEKRRAQYLSGIRDNVKASFMLFGKVHGASITVADDKGFDALCATYEIRNRLMHPKTPWDPNVSNDTITQAKRGVAWFIKEYAKLLEKCSAAVPTLGKID